MTVSEQIINVLDALCDKFGVAIDWTSQNVVPYIEALCKKLISFEIATSIFWMCVPLVVFAVFMPTTCTLCKKASNLKHSWDDDEPITWCAITSIIITVIVSVWVLIGVPMQIYDIIEAITFPEKTIIEYISNLIKTQ